MKFEPGFGWNKLKAPHVNGSVSNYRWAYNCTYMCTCTSSACLLWGSPSTPTVMTGMRWKKTPPLPRIPLHVTPTTLSTYTCLIFHCLALPNVEATQNHNSHRLEGREKIFLLTVKHTRYHYSYTQLNLLNTSVTPACGSLYLGLNTTIDLTMSYHEQPDIRKTLLQLQLISSSKEPANQESFSHMLRKWN